MAIAFDTIVESNTITVPINNPILFIGITGAVGTDDVTAVKIGSISGTFVGKILNPGVNGRYQYLYVFIAPPTGSQTVTVTGTQVDGFCITYTGAKQTGGVEGANTGTNGGSGTSLAVVVTTVTDKDWVVGYFSSSNGNKPYAGSGATARSNASTITFLDSNGIITPAGSFTLNGSCATSGLAMIACGIVPASAPPTNASFLLRMI